MLEIYCIIALCNFSWHSLGCTFIDFNREGCFYVWVLTCCCLCLLSGIMLQVLLFVLLAWLLKWVSQNNSGLFSSCWDSFIWKKGIKQFSPDFAACRWNIVPRLLRTSLSPTSLACSLSLSFPLSWFLYVVHLESATCGSQSWFISKTKWKTSIGIIFRMTRLWSAGWLIFV